MAGFGFGYGYLKGSKMVYNADATTYFNAVTTPFSASRKALINTLVNTLQSDGNWDLLDCLWLLANEASDQGLINLVNPAQTAMTLVNAPTFIVDRGFTSNGSTSYINTNWDAATNGVNFLQDSASYGVYSRTDIDESGAILGGRNATTGNTFLMRTGNVFSRRVTCTTNVAAGANTNSLGHHYAYRVNSTQNIVGKNGANVSTGAATSVAHNTTDIYILCSNANGTAATFSNAQCALAYFGSGSINQLEMFNAIESYMDAIGAGVVA